MIPMNNPILDDPEKIGRNDSPSDDSVVHTRTAVVWIEEDRFIRSAVREGAEETLDDAKEFAGAVKKLNRGRALPLLIDMRGLKSIVRDARVYYRAGEFSREISACALLIDSPLTRIIAAFLLGMNKPSYPLKSFRSVDEALAWLEGFSHE